MACGTFIEAEYGTATSQFLLYDNPWFHALIALLALNLLVAILLRFPWKRRHIPFLTAHVGITILLFGCYITWKYGEEAQITLPEGTIGTVASKPTSPQFEFQFIDHIGSLSDTHRVPFRPGPFSWQDYHYENWLRDGKRYKALLWPALQITPRNTGKRTLRAPDIRFEVLDYLAHSAVEPVPPFELSIRWNTPDEGDSPHWERVSLPLQPQQGVPGLADVRGVSTTMPNGERITYNLALSQKEATAFWESWPKHGEDAGLWGEVVLHYNGQNHSAKVEQLLELDGDARFPVEDSGLSIGNVRFRDRGPIITFSVFTPNGDMEAMTLLPDNPELNVQARRLGIFGFYWVDPVRIMEQSADHADSPMLQRLAAPRLDFMQGPDKNLYYRFWSGRRMIFSGVQFDLDGQNKPPKFEVAIQTPYAREVIIEQFIPQDVPGGRIVPATANPNRHSEQRVKMRVEFEGVEDTFWLRAATPTVVPLPPDQDQIRYIYGNGQTLGVQLNFETIDLGFGILLKRFERRTEPGIRMSSHYSSLVDYVEPIEPTGRRLMFSHDLENYRVLPDGENILISMNRPGFFRGTGGGYRIYQSSYIGPFYPDQPQFHELYDGSIFPWESRPRESIAMSTLSVNDDPGRGWKYFGSFLLVLGCALFVWRRKPE